MRTSPIVGTCAASAASIVGTAATGAVTITTASTCIDVGDDADGEGCRISSVAAFLASLIIAVAILLHSRSDISGLKHWTICLGVFMT